MDRHPTGLVSGIPVVAFTMIGLTFLLGDITWFDLGWDWLWPAAIIVVGVALLASMRPGRD